jgi:hypothetical protein
VRVPATQTSYTFTGMAAGSYTGTVAATNADGTSAYSVASKSVTLAAAPKVTKVTATATSATAVKVSWTMADPANRAVLVVTLKKSGKTVATKQLWSDAGPATFTGLAGATSYTASVVVKGATKTVSDTVRTPASKVRSHAVSIQGKAKVGKVLTVNLHRASWSKGTHFAYVWTANGKRVGKGAKLKLTGKLAKKRIVVHVTGSIKGWKSSTVTSKAVVVKR